MLKLLLLLFVLVSLCVAIHGPGMILGSIVRQDVGRT